MKKYISNLPLRQKILLSLTILVGVFILTCCYLQIIESSRLSFLIFFYGMMVPLFLLSTETLIDLDDITIIFIWSIIAVVFLITYFVTKGNPSFVVQRPFKYNEGGIDKFICNNWCSSLKGLPTFLIFYFLFNSIVKKKTGNYIVNTFRQSRLYNDEAQRKIYWYDLLTTFTLLIIILFASLLDFR